jgi:tRNA G18 (ribose-2'-O)-methylase SpoU
MRKLQLSELNRISANQFKKANKLPIIVALDNVRSLNNVGSVFRTADAFRIEALYLCGVTGTPPHREIQKTALGATESVLWKHYTNTLGAIHELKNKNYTIIALEQVENGTKLQQFIPQKEKSYALVFGNEVNGVSQEVINLCDACVEIPQFGTKHSFNISVSAGIVLWDMYCKLLH